MIIDLFLIPAKVAHFALVPTRNTLAPNFVFPMTTLIMMMINTKTRNAAGIPAMVFIPKSVYFSGAPLTVLPFEITTDIP